MLLRFVFFFFFLKSNTSELWWNSTQNEIKKKNRLQFFVFTLKRKEKIAATTTKTATEYSMKYCIIFSCTHCRYDCQSCIHRWMNTLCERRDLLLIFNIHKDKSHPHFRAIQQTNAFIICFMIWTKRPVSKLAIKS